MIIHNKVALIGGTGKAGKYLLKQLLLHKYSVKLLHRKPEILNIDSPLLEIIKGDARDYAAVEKLLSGCDAVLSCLSQPVGEPTIFSEATGHILKAMSAMNIKRYIVIAGLNVDTQFDDKSSVTLFGTNWMKENFPLTTADRQVEYELLLESRANWTMIRLPLINQTDEFCEIVVSLTDCPGNNISASSLGMFMIDLLNSTDFIKQAPFIANAE